MKKTIIFVFICSLPLLSNAQVSSYIIGGTSNCIVFRQDSHLGYMYSQPGYNFGVLFDFPFSKSWSFQTGLNYNSIASDDTSFWYQVFDEGCYSTYTFLEIPACISLRLKLSEKTNLRFNTGAFMGIFTGGIRLLRTSNGFSDYVLERPYGYANFGFLLGTGIEINKIYLGIEGNIYALGYMPEGTIKTKLGIRF